MSVTYVYFTFGDQDYEYCFNHYHSAVSFAEDIKKKHGVEVEIFEKDVG